MSLQPYETKYCQQLYNLFYETVHTINLKDYNKNQLDSWAPLTIDLNTWCQSLLDNYSLIYLDEANNIIAFGDITKDGYLNRLYVHKDHNGKGIGSLLADQLEAYAKTLGLSEITTHSSITAKPFFEKRGYHLIKEQTVQRNGQQLTNYIMKKTMHTNK